MQDLYQQFQSFANSLNCHIESPLFNGLVQRFDWSKPQSGWYIGAALDLGKESFLVATVGDWVTGEKFTFRSDGKLSRQDNNILKFHISQTLEKALHEKRQSQDEASVKARRIWEETPPAISHPYLIRKKIDACGSKVLDKTLIVKCQNIYNETVGIQFIEEDGKKRFLSCQKVKGTFFVLGEIGKETTEAYLCEGFSTGASLYMALGKPVICCFSASNLVEVSKLIHTHYPRTKVKICADDDMFNDKNVGRSFGEKAASVFMSKPIFPTFKDLSSKPTDFNDLHCLEGLDQVKKIIALPRECHGYKPLGMLGSTHYFLLNSTNQIFKMSHFTPEKIFVLCRKDYLASMYPGNKGGINWEDVKNAIVQQSLQAGTLNPDKIRGVGVWLDAKRTIINTGKNLIIDGVSLPLSEIDSSYIYISSKNQFTAEEEPLSTKESTKLVDVLKLFKWQRNADSILLSGWIALARIAGSLSHRPHIFITGAKGTGKSTLIHDVVNPALGKSAFEALGGTTAAGIRQSIGADSLPIVYDEFETGDEENRQNRNLMDLFRQAWSASDSKIFKGTPEGQAFNYAPLFPVLLGGIRTHFFNDADRSRFSVLELNAHDSNQDYKNKMDEAISEIDKTFGDRLFSRSVGLINIIRQNAKIIVGVLADQTCQRFANQVGILLAGYYSLISESAITKEEVLKLLDSLELEQEAGETEEEDHYQCLDFLLTKKITYRIEGIQEEGTIGHLLNSKNTSTNSILEKIGIKKLGHSFAIAYRHTELSILFEKTRWKTWVSSLKRIKGSYISNIRIESRQTKSVCLPLSVIEDSHAD